MAVGIAARAGGGATGFEFIVAIGLDLPTGISFVGISGSLVGRLDLPVGISDGEAFAFFTGVRFCFGKVLSL
jgi:hypothetical protein